jgi:hypothetical protein
MKTIFIFILGFFSLKAVSQNKNIYFEHHITYLQYKNDTINLEFPKVITLKEFGCTPITHLGYFGKNQYGVKLEILKSNVGLKEEFILAKCFYIKEGDIWKEIFKSASLQREVIFREPREVSNDKDWSRGSEGGNNEFNFTYMQLLFSY